MNFGHCMVLVVDFLGDQAVNNDNSLWCNYVWGQTTNTTSAGIQELPREAHDKCLRVSHTENIPLPQ